MLFDQCIKQLLMLRLSEESRLSITLVTWVIIYILTFRHTGLATWQEIGQFLITTIISRSVYVKQEKSKRSALSLCVFQVGIKSVRIVGFAQALFALYISCR